MKRQGNLMDKIYSLENLELADRNARKGKGDQYGVQRHDESREDNLHLLQGMLINKTFKTSPYTTFKIYEPKEREIFRLPYFPDRILHHAVMNIIGPILTSTFTADTYSCIKGKGIHGTVRGIKKTLMDVPGTTYCLKLDIKKFYPNIDHRTLKQLLRRKFKDQDLLELLDGIIDSAPGLPIGNYLSQYFANFYLTYFDHWIKEDIAVKHYFRYADDIAVFSGSKEYLHGILAAIKTYLSSNLKLEVKGNYQIFPVEARGVDMVGYVFFHTHTRLRKSIKQNFARMVARNRNKASITSYWGWAKHCNSKHLIKTLFNEAV